MDSRLEDLYRQHSGDLVGFATVLVGPDDALDVVSEAVLATIARDSLQSVGDVRGYWLRAVANTAAGWHRSRFRRLRREATAAQRSVVPGQETSADDARRLLSDLSIQQRAVVYLTYWHDLVPSAVAELLGVGEGTVRKQLARGREHLREAYRNG